MSSTCTRARMCCTGICRLGVQEQLKCRGRWYDQLFDVLMHDGGWLWSWAPYDLLVDPCFQSTSVWFPYLEST